MEKIIKDALVCTVPKRLVLEVFTDHAPYIETGSLSNKILADDVEDIPGIDVLIYHLKRSSGFTLKDQSLQDFAGVSVLKEINNRANDLPTVIPNRISLNWE